MSVVLASALAGGYAASMIGFHRWNVRRLRRAAGLTGLARLDWGALLQGLLPGDGGPPDTALPRQLPDGSPTPLSLCRGGEATAARRALLLEVATGGEVAEPSTRAAQAGFTGAEAQWVELLSLARRRPAAALERLEAARPTTVAEAYLREHLRLLHGLNALNLELVAFTSKRRLFRALDRFGDVPCLYFARALASATVGLNGAALDDLGRAVYFSQSAPFYVQVVLDTPWIAEVRPALVYQCRQGRHAPPEPG